MGTRAAPALGRLGMLVALLAGLISVATAPPVAATSPALVRPGALAPGSAPAGSTALGSVPGRQQLDLSVVLPPSNRGRLQTLLADLYDPSSSNYHKWLGPGQFARQFGPSASEVAAVESWLHGAGLTATSVSGFTVNVVASETHISSALGTDFEQYRDPTGRLGYLARQAPLVPSTLAKGQVQAILGLNTVAHFEPEGIATPTQASGGATLRPNADGLTPCAAAQTAASSSYYTFDTIGAAYGLGTLLADGQDGDGETIAVYELASHSPTDVDTYETCFGLTNPVATQAVGSGGGAIGGDGTIEADADIEEAATEAPSASIISYEGSNSTADGAYDTWQTIVDKDAAQVVTSSWGICEPLAETGGEIGSFTPLFEQAAMQGQTVLVAAGDSGSEGCYPDNGSTIEEVDYPASDPWVTAVGGTSRLANGTETAWNACQTETGQNKTTCVTNYAGQAAGGGGQSRYESRPSDQPNIVQWSTAQGCGTQCREVPDISSNAGVGMVAYANGAWDAYGGTSLASPLLAGLVADRNDGCAATSGLWAPALYSLASEGAYGSAFTDITSGNTDMTGSNGGAFAATVGYDAATGIGSPLAPGLSCPEVTSVSSGASGSTVTVSGLGLEHATISFGSTTAQVLSATATAANVVVPAGSGTTTVAATSVLGKGTQVSTFTFAQAPNPAPAPAPVPVTSTHGYWLVGGDGGIFSFGSAQFYGSTGSVHLQRPVVGITPTSDRAGYWLVASDGGIFAYGDSGFYGSIPGLGIAPAGTPGNVPKLDAPIVGMVPSADGGGYFMVGSDGGVFAFGDARFAGSCPQIGGCDAPAVAVMPDATGNGYWVVTSAGSVYSFGDAPYYGAPGAQSVGVTSAVRTPDGRGYWILFSNGVVAGYGDAAELGGPVGALGGADPASAILTTSSGDGYWVASADGAVYDYGDAPDDGSMAGQHLNAPIVAATGW